MNRSWILATLCAACGSVQTSAPDAGPPAPDAATVPPTPTWSDDIRLTDDPADSLVTYNFAHSVAAVGSTVHAVWYDTRDGTSQIYYKRSLDGGTTWEPDHRLVNDATVREHPAIAAAGDAVYVAWQDHRSTGPFDFYVTLIRSLDGGATWLAPVTMTATGASAQPSLAADGDTVELVWSEAVTGTTEIVHRASLDRGATWTDPVQLSSPQYESWVPNVAVSGDLAIASWVDYRDANEEEYQRRSTDGGRTWGAITRLTDQPADSWAPCVAIAGDVVHRFWFDRRDSAYSDVDVETQLDAAAALVGVTVEPIPPRDPAVYYLDDFAARLGRKVQRIIDAAPAWVAGGGDPAALQALLDDYQARYAAWMTSWEIYYQRSTDRGATYGAAQRMTDAPYLSQRPSVAAVGDRVDVVWFDGRDGDGSGGESDTEVYYRGSVDGGLTWSDDLRLTDAPGASRHASIAATADRVDVLWLDGRDGGDGHAEIYYKRLTR